MSTSQENIFRLICEEEYFNNTVNKIELGKVNIESLFAKTVKHALAGYLLECISFYLEYLDSSDNNYITEEEFNKILVHYNNILGTNIENT